MRSARKRFARRFVRSARGFAARSAAALSSPARGCRSAQSSAAPSPHGGRRDQPRAGWSSVMTRVARRALNHDAPTDDGEIVGGAAAKGNPVADLNAGTDCTRRCCNVRADMRCMALAKSVSSNRIFIEANPSRDHPPEPAGGSPHAHRASRQDRHDRGARRIRLHRHLRQPDRLRLQLRVREARAQHGYHLSRQQADGPCDHRPCALETGLCRDHRGRRADFPAARGRVRRDAACPARTRRGVPALQGMDGGGRGHRASWSGSSDSWWWAGNISRCGSRSPGTGRRPHSGFTSRFWASSFS